MNELLVKINFLIPGLPRAEKVFAQALVENPEAIANMTLAEAARETNSSDASIIRFCKRLDFHGFSDLKRACIAHSMELEQQKDMFDEKVRSTDTMEDIIKKVFQSNIQTLQNTMVMADNNYQKAVDALIHAKSIHFFGVGDAFAACQFAFMKFCRLGVDSSAESDNMMQFMRANNMKPGDVALAVSYEGRSRNVVQAMSIAKKRGATTICITKMSKSPLLKYTDIPLYIAISDLSVGRDKVTRRVADMFILDVLYLGYINQKEFDFARSLRRSQIAIDCNKIK
ncbi:MAG: MurR/RpiR family transcriptional regulator [Blautia sp.]|nr:MurR/RpiR family transcriptional regulator [Blautia sp.]